MNSSDNFDPLLEQAARLPAEIQPQRDLWPDIAARLNAPVPTPRRRWPLSLAAAAALVALTATVTWRLTVMQVASPPAQTLAEDREAILLADRLGYCEAYVGEHVTDLAENVDDSLEFREIGTRKSFTFTDTSDPDLGWFIKWDESDGTGSLRAPDYNDGNEACWDEHQNDVECGPVAS